MGRNVNGEPSRAHLWHPFEGYFSNNKNNSIITHNSEDEMDSNSWAGTLLGNFTLDVDDPDFDLLRQVGWRGLIIALYVIVIAFGLIGNTVVVVIVVRNRKMWNVTNLCIVNLALSDIGLCLFSMPVQLYYQLTDNWIFGEAMCRVVFAAFAIPLYMSTLTVMLIAYDRYWLILHPFKVRMSMRRAFAFLVVSFVMSVGVAVPVIVNTSMYRIQRTLISINRNYCVERWQSAAVRKSYSVFIFAMQFCLPLCLTAILYARVYNYLKTRSRRPPHRFSLTQKRREKTNKILFAIVSLFIICWLPWNMFSLLTELDRRIVKGVHYKFVDLLLKVFAMSSSCVNPFLYCWLNDNFRREFNHIAMTLSRRPHGALTPDMGSEGAVYQSVSRPAHLTVPHYQMQPLVPREGTY